MHEDIATIELVHSAWIDYERAGDLDGLLTLCAYDIEFWPPNAPPVIGREQITRYLNYPETVIHDIKVYDRRVRISHEPPEGYDNSPAAVLGRPRRRPVAGS